ncbi:COMM domain-containing protein 10-like isoform X2 [Dreissena polymorpha]|uniref:COMM domain-containing protein 10-like isoform X2 n=1 Tax=Dreissena polymorpha TaxID=45954 RepID=UPI002264DA3F|nr:COMM domain-containing protein 10-like isoform X2 [Dreissena polymorpha]
MAALMFTSTPSIKKAVALINKLDDGKFRLVLSRIMQRLHLKDERTFSEEEEEKLQQTLGIDGPELELVLQTLEFLLQQAAYHAAKPAVLSQQLTQLELEQAKVEAIVSVWTTNGRDVLQKLRQQTLHPSQLEDINWRLNLQIAQSSVSKQKLPNAMFELGVRDSEEGVGKKKIRVEFTHIRDDTKAVGWSKLMKALGHL